MIEVAARGGFTVVLGRISGRCGYLDPATRTIVLNPDAPPDALEAELRHELEMLAGLDGTDPGPTHPTGLALVHNTHDDVDEPAGPDLDDPPDLRVVG